MLYSDKITPLHLLAHIKFSAFVKKMVLPTSLFLSWRRRGALIHNQVLKEFSDFTLDRFSDLILLSSVKSEQMSDLQ